MVKHGCNPRLLIAIYVERPADFHFTSVLLGMFGPAWLSTSAADDSTAAGSPMSRPKRTEFA
jgi:hypothetical protein